MEYLIVAILLVFRTIVSRYGLPALLITIVLSVVAGIISAATGGDGWKAFEYAVATSIVVCLVLFIIKVPSALRKFN